MIRFKVLLTLFIISGVVANLNAQDTKNALEVSKLFKVDGMLENHLTIVDRIILRYKEDLTHVPDSFWENQNQALKNEFNDHIQTQLIEIYTQSLSNEEINETINLINENKISELNKSYLLTYQKAINLAEKMTATITQELNLYLENSPFLKSSITQDKCKEFQIGNYINLMGDGTEVLIEKNDSIQISRVGDNFIKFEIKLLTECDYSLTLIETNFAHLKDAIGDVIEIYPYEVDNDIIRYKSIMPEVGAIIYGELKKY